MLIGGFVHNKISSQLSLLNAPSSRKSEEFNLKDIEGLVDSKDQHWFKCATLENFGDKLKLGQDGKQTRALLQAGLIPHNMGCWSGPKD